MKVNCKNIFTKVFILIVMSSCNKKDFLNTEDHYTTKNLVPIELALEVAKKFDPEIYLKRDLNRSIISLGGGATNSDHKQNITSQYIFKDKKGNPSSYVFNFENNKGFLIVSADYGIRPILAFIETGNFSSSFMPDGFKDWVNRTNENVDVLRNLEYDNTVNGALAWRKYFSEYKVDTTVLFGKPMPIDPDPNPCQNPPPPLFNIVGPLLSTAWGQECSYNDLCALDKNFDCGFCSNGRPLTGCVATTIAQIIRYHEYPKKYNFGAMNSNAGNYNVQMLMRDAGLSVGMQYTCNFSWTLKQVIAPAFYNKFGYSSANFWYYSTNSFDRIKQNISTYKWPVVFGGNTGFNETGHVWVCDGVSETTYYFGDCGISNSAATYLNFHMNWGWHEIDGRPDYNGWYAFDNWTINGQWNYQYNSFAITEIHP